MAKKGYWIVCHVSAADGSVMAEYAKLARPVIEAAGGRLIVRGNPAKTCEAGVNEPAVVVEFESLEKAIAVYESEGYQKALKVLNNKVKRDFRIVEGM
ncbi:MAG TPA: DUF1330 domain-containing protein [Candidatus Acidoferrales bacterium]|nr:DUF1330 domain-containing protein [Candidatus Acidoferrales bacterium]